MNRLVLKKETVADLTPGELESVAAGTQVSRTCALVSFVPCYVVQTLLGGCLP
jgi:hypothetical protein